MNSFSTTLSSSTILSILEFVPIVVKVCGCGWRLSMYGHRFKLNRLYGRFPDDRMIYLLFHHFVVCGHIHVNAQTVLRGLPLKHAYSIDYKVYWEWVDPSPMPPYDKYDFYHYTQHMLPLDQHESTNLTTLRIRCRIDSEMLMWVLRQRHLTTMRLSGSIVWNEDTITLLAKVVGLSRWKYLLIVIGQVYLTFFVKGSNCVVCLMKYEWDSSQSKYSVQSGCDVVWRKKTHLYGDQFMIYSTNNGIIRPLLWRPDAKIIALNGQNPSIKEHVRVVVDEYSYHSVIQYDTALLVKLCQTLKCLKKLEISNMRLETLGLRMILRMRQQSCYLKHCTMFDAFAPSENRISVDGAKVVCVFRDSEKVEPHLSSFGYKYIKQVNGWNCYWLVHS